MLLFTTKEEYLEKFEAQVRNNRYRDDDKEIINYMRTLFDQLDKLLEGLSQENYWVRIPNILGIDAKLVLLSEMCQLEEFTVSELIRIIELDYRTYSKELCGYDLSMKPSHSLIFNVS